MEHHLTGVLTDTDVEVHVVGARRLQLRKQRCLRLYVDAPPPKFVEVSGYRIHRGVIGPYVHIQSLVHAGEGARQHHVLAVLGVRHHDGDLFAGRALIPLTGMKNCSAACWTAMDHDG